MAPASQSLMKGQSIKTSASGPGIEGPVAEFIRCSFCSRYISTYGPLLTGGSVQDLGSSVFDPMIPVEELTSQLKVREIFSFASRHIFPNLRLGEVTTDLYHAWAFPLDDKLKLFSFLWSSKYQEDVLRLTYEAPVDPAGLKEQFTLKGLTLMALRNEFSTYTGQKPIDSIIMCMLVLAVHETASERIYREPSPFSPMFIGLHALELYGSRNYNPLHWKVLHELLGKYGGLESLRTFGLGWQISLADLTNSAHTLRKPICSLIDVYGRKIDLDPPLVRFAPYGGGFSPTGAEQQPGSGFSELLCLQPPVHENVVTVFSHIGELSFVINYLSMQPCGPRLLDLLADSRDLIHHRLFSQPNEADTPDRILQLNDQSYNKSVERSLEIYQITRLTMLLYATHVTFPLPRSTVVRGPLLSQLCPQIQALVARGVSSPLLLWCASVVLIALEGAEPSNGILILFQQVCGDLEVTSLETLLGILWSFAWVDSAVDHHYSGIWKDLF
ncbi:hypothetical protein BJX65DRAFT_304487 [Aspergillus insuetus]